MGSCPSNADPNLGDGTGKATYRVNGGVPTAGTLTSQNGGLSFSQEDGFSSYTDGTSKTIMMSESKGPVDWWTGADCYNFANTAGATMQWFLDWGTACGRNRKRNLYVTPRFRA